MSRLGAANNHIFVFGLFILAKSDQSVNANI